MKKAILILLALVMVLSLCACGGTTATEPTPEPTPQKPQAVLDVEALIDAIGEVSITSKSSIELAEKEYNYLNDTDKEQVGNYTTLMRAIDKYDEVFNDFLIGTWISEEFIVEAEDNIPFMDIGDTATISYTLRDGGIAEITRTDITKNSENTVGYSGDLNNKLTWVLKDDTITINESAAFIGLVATTGLKIDYDSGSLVDIQTGSIYTKSE